MPASAAQQQQAPYDSTARVWRDEQPGDDPRLVLSVVFVKRDGSEAWRDVRLDRVEVRTDGRAWRPRESAVVSTADGGFEITGSGDATLPAGARATVAVTLHTSSGEQHLEWTVEIGRVG